MTWSDGTYYEGEWLNNKVYLIINQAHGTGKFSYADGDVYDGLFAENKFCG